MEQEIIDCIHGIPQKVAGAWTNTNWTNAVKAAFAELGKKHGWIISASMPKEAEADPEWLFDLTWYKYATDDPLGLEIGLILESEWSEEFGELRYDFEKLIIGKSPYKVFIFEAASDDIKNTMLKLNSVIDHCRHSSAGETYIFAGWDGARKRFVTAVKEVES